MIQMLTENMSPCHKWSWIISLSDYMSSPSPFNIFETFLVVAILTVLVSTVMLVESTPVYTPTSLLEGKIKGVKFILEWDSVIYQ